MCLIVCFCSPCSSVCLFVTLLCKFATYGGELSHRPFASPVCLLGCLLGCSIVCCMFGYLVIWSVVCLFVCLFVRLFFVLSCLVVFLYVCLFSYFYNNNNNNNNNYNYNYNYNYDAYTSNNTNDSNSNRNSNNNNNNNNANTTNYLYSKLTSTTYVPLSIMLLNLLSCCGLLLCCSLPYFCARLSFFCCSFVSMSVSVSYSSVSCLACRNILLSFVDVLFSIPTQPRNLVAENIFYATNLIGSYINNIFSIKL